MKLFLAKIVGLMKDENLFASQGGPIILVQVITSYVIAKYWYKLIDSRHFCFQHTFRLCVYLIVYSRFLLMEQAIFNSHVPLQNKFSM